MHQLQETQAGIASRVRRASRDTGPQDLRVADSGATAARTAGAAGGLD